MSDLRDFPPEPHGTIGRWRFLDGEVGAEADYKAAMIDRIDQFWRNFRGSPLFAPGAEASLSDFRSRDWMLENLATVDPELEWEMNHGGVGPSVLAICRGGGLDLMPVVVSMVERAGEIPDWIMSGCRLPLEPENVAGAYEARTGKVLPPYRFELNPTKGNAIDVTISSPSFVGIDRDVDLEAAFVICEIVLGEENLNKWLNLLDTKSFRNWFFNKFDSEQVASEFKQSFERQKLKGLSTLLKRGYFEGDLNDDLIWITFSDQRMDRESALERSRLTFLTRWPALMLTISGTENFFSERFSTTGEKFAYLHLISDQPEYSDEFRGQFEASLDKLLVDSSLGCLVGTGRGKPDSYYFDLCLTDPDKAISVLRQFCQQQKLPKTCWLRFYDYFWNREWVRMLPDTPDLKEPTLMW